MEEFLRRAPLILFASAKPFQYPNTDWGGAVQMIGLCLLDPYGRDKFEVARRVEVAQCGTRLPAKKLSPSLLRTKVREAMTTQNGARWVAAGFAATGGTARGGDLFEHTVLGIGAG